MTTTSIRYFDLLPWLKLVSNYFRHDLLTLQHGIAHSISSVILCITCNSQKKSECFFSLTLCVPEQQKYTSHYRHQWIWKIAGDLKHGKITETEYKAWPTHGQTQIK